MRGLELAQLGGFGRQLTIQPLVVLEGRVTLLLKPVALELKRHLLGLQVERLLQ